MNQPNAGIGIPFTRPILPCPNLGADLNCYSFLPRGGLEAILDCYSFLPIGGLGADLNCYSFLPKGGLGADLNWYSFLPDVPELVQKPSPQTLNMTLYMYKRICVFLFVCLFVLVGRAHRYQVGKLHCR
jgi:hypothetical protein